MVLHCPLADVCHLEGLHSLLFFFMLDLMAKTENPSLLDDRFDGFLVPPLWDFVADDPDELVLCLVRAVQLDLKRTKQYRLGCKCLFISIG